MVGNQTGVAATSLVARLTHHVRHKMDITQFILPVEGVGRIQTYLERKEEGKK